MAETPQESVQEYEYKAEMKQLLHLIVHSLYTHPEIFLRELISNASDALNKIRFRLLTDRNVLDADADLAIRIELDQNANSFMIEDSGIGMTSDELVSNIGTVASSGTLEFLQQMKQEGRSLDGNLVGRFGVGFYSVFMVADEVTIETRHADPNSKGYRWKSAGENKFTIEEIDSPKRGTRIELKLKKEAEEFSERYRVKAVIRRYSNFVDFPIYVDKEKVNTVLALWHRPKDQISEEELQDFYKFISNDFRPALGHLQLSIEGAVNFRALIFIPESTPYNLFKDSTERSLHLYSSKVFIQDNCLELLPDYLHFAKGVVDSEDLPLNVSREVTQSSPTMAKIRDVLTRKLLSFLEEWSEKEKPKFEKFYQGFGPLFKTGLNSDFGNRERIINLLRFESTKAQNGELTSLHDYVARMKEGQKEIYYLSGEHRDLILRNPNLEYFKKNEFEVLLLTDPIDTLVVPTLREYESKPLKSIDKANVDFAASEDGKTEALSSELSKSLIEVFKETLGDRVEDVVVSKRLVDSAVTLVVGEKGVDSQVEKMMRMMNPEFSVSKRILEINMSHPLIRNLSRLNLGNSKDARLRNCIMQLYEGALLIEGNLTSPTEFVSRMTELMEEATKGL